MIKQIELRIKYLEELIALTKIDKSFPAQTRLDEAKYIYELLTNPDASPFAPYTKLK
jgi:hypothetical protein